MDICIVVQTSHPSYQANQRKVEVSFGVPCSCFQSCVHICSPKFIGFHRQQICAFFLFVLTVNHAAACNCLLSWLIVMCVWLRLLLLPAGQKSKFSFFGSGMHASSHPIFSSTFCVLARSLLCTCVGIICLQSMSWGWFKFNLESQWSTAVAVFSTFAHQSSLSALFGQLHGVTGDVFKNLLVACFGCFPNQKMCSQTQWQMLCQKHVAMSWGCNKCKMCIQNAHI